MVELTLGGLLAFHIGLLPSVAGPRRGACDAADREALLVAALNLEVEGEVWAGGKPAGWRRPDCVAVSIGQDSAATDPPDKVMQRLFRISSTRVVLLRDRHKCKAPVTTWVAEPRCSGIDAYVQTRTHHHCSVPFRKVGNRWETRPVGPCE